MSIQISPETSRVIKYLCRRQPKSCAPAISAASRPQLTPAPSATLSVLTGKIQYYVYGYNVRVWTAALFTAAFALTTVLHLVQAGYSRRRFLFWTLCAGSALEMGGWAARLTSATSITWVSMYGGVWDSNGQAFLAQIVMLIIAPAFNAAGLYLILGEIIRLLGQRYCKLEPRTYVWIFCVGDFLSLLIQAAGGGIAATAATVDMADLGAYIMVGGVLVQIVVMLCFTGILADFSYRYIKDKPTAQIHPFACFGRRQRQSAVSSASSQQTIINGGYNHRSERHVRFMLLGLSISTLFIFIRSIYRCPELLSGWRGSIIENQTLFDCLDGLMILASLVTLNVLHPLWLLPRLDASHSEAMPLTEVNESKL